MILLIYSHSFLVWHGDAMEIGRHSLQVSIQFYLSLWTAILLTIDYVYLVKSKDKATRKRDELFVKRAH